MGEMADCLIDDIFEMESQKDLYASGFMGMEDAFDLGFIDASGVEHGLDRAYSDSVIGTREELDSGILTQGLLLQVADGNRVSGNNSAPSPYRLALKKNGPTCNVCRLEMKARNGKFGKFYYCKCPDQVTVSDRYWQSLKGSRS